jgi:hypothetical protein
MPCLSDPWRRYAPSSAHRRFSRQYTLFFAHIDLRLLEPLFGMRVGRIRKGVESFCVFSSNEASCARPRRSAGAQAEG